MGKQTSARRLGENQSMAVATRLRTSAQKLNLVAEMIRQTNRRSDKVLMSILLRTYRIRYTAITLEPLREPMVLIVWLVARMLNRGARR